MDLQKVVNRDFPEIEASYDFRNTILYALGTGFGAKPLDPSHLRFLYEDGLVAVPTMANVLGHPGFWVREPQYGIDWQRLLHAEQRLIMHRTLPPEGRVVSRHKVIGVRDRGESAGAMVYVEKELADAEGAGTIASVITTIMMRGDGGCGDYGTAPPELEKLPEGSPVRSIEVQTEEISPLIYRLSGDLNPLHIDPKVAINAGFERPILHGLATKGFAAYAILNAFCSFDPDRLKSLALRFTSPVMPGDRIRFDFWGEAPGGLRFRASVPARGCVVLDRGTAEIA